MTLKRVAILAAAILLLGSGAAIYAKTGSHGGGAPSATQAAGLTVSSRPGAQGTGNAPGALTTPAAGGTSSSAKQDNGGNYRPVVTTPPAPAPPAPSGAADLAVLDCSLTAQANADGSISLMFYVQGPGYFTVQQQDGGGNWQTVKENVFYAGSGGLDAGSMPAGTDGIVLRLLKLGNGQYTAVSKPFSVSRQDVTAAGGLKSF